MRTHFQHLSPLKRTDYSELFKTSIIVPDSNVLLNLYKYPRLSRKKILSTLKKFEDRLWIPHQVAEEFYRNRAEIITSQVSLCDSLKTTVKSNIDNIRKYISEKYANHPYISKEVLSQKLDEFQKNILKELQKGAAHHPNHLQDDDIEEELNKIFTGKTGNAYTKEKLEEIYQEGTKRYELSVPPGYKDIDKDKIDNSKTRKYGDLIIWFQLIDKSKELSKPVIFITADQKVDWWQIVSNGMVVGPRYELVQEMYAKSGQRFHLYKLTEFMEHSAQYLKLKPSKSIIEQIRLKEDEKIQEEKLASTTHLDYGYHSEIESSTLLASSSKLAGTITEPNITTTQQVQALIQVPTDLSKTDKQGNEAADIISTKEKILK